ncbi:hypothetical protein KEM54_001384 [Ascosphaera aggregata]|nr:hypothetical protein KEM54_001384 [Ascosphaera aggregata]
MVSFQCEACGDVLTKKKLDPHRGRCNWASFTCIDCMVHFDGTSYRAHTSCMTEAEKYEKGLYQPKDKRNNKTQQKSALTCAPSSKPSAPAAPASTETPAEKSQPTPAPTATERLGKRKRMDDAESDKSMIAKAVNDETPQQPESNSISKRKSNRKSSSIPSPPTSPRAEKEGSTSASSDLTSQFMEIAKKHATSDLGISMHKLLKKYHKKLKASGHKEEKGGKKSRMAEEEALWKALMLKTNDQGEIVLMP